jgi:hypothetical protein
MPAMTRAMRTMARPARALTKGAAFYFYTLDRVFVEMRIK